MIQHRKAPPADLKVPNDGKQAPATPPKQLRVKCDSCKAQFKLDGAMESTPDPDNARVTIHGVRCPHCQHYTLSYRMDRDLEKKRKLVEEAAQAYQAIKTEKAWERYQRLKAEYGKEFERLNPPKEKAA